MPSLFCRLIFPVLLLACHAAYADMQDDRRLQSDMTLPKMMLPSDVVLPMPSVSNGVLEIDEQALLANPSLLSRAMLSVLVANDVSGTRLLLPIYQKQDDQFIESELLIWADAVLSGAAGKHGKASGIYRSLYQQYPNNVLFAVRLIQSLFADKQYLQAKALLAKQPADIAQELHAYQTALTNLTKPSLSFSGNVIVDKNINNAPNQTDLGGGWTANAPEQAHGIAINVGVDKKILFDDGVVFEPAVSVSAKLFSDTKHYNETQIRLSASTAKNHAGGGVFVSPFVESLWYAGGKKGVNDLSHFSDTMGVGVGGHKRLGQKSQLAVHLELAKYQHNIRHHLSGHGVGFGATLTTRPAWLGDGGWASVSVDHQRVNTQDLDDSYTRVGVRGIIGKQWQDFGVRGGIHIAQRRYHAPMPIFSQIQKNHEYFANVSIWHNKISYLGLTPKLTWQYQKNDSNIALYSYDKNRVFVEIGRQF